MTWRKSGGSASNAGANCIEVAAWRKGSRSPSQGANCVEVGSWRTATRSGSGSNGANCVEVGEWRTASRSGDNQGNCVEAGACDCHGIAIRDTKHHASGTLAVTTGEWSRLLSVLKDAQ